MTKKGFSAIEVIVALTVLAVLGLGGYVWWHNRGSPTLPAPDSPRFSALLQKDLLSGPPRSLDSQLAPQIEFEEYVLAEDVAPPTLPTRIKVYTFETNLSTQQAAQTPQKLSLTLNAQFAQQNTLAFTNFSDLQNLGWWVADAQAGGFEFQGFGQHQSTSLPADASPAQIAEAFLKEIGVWDETLAVTTTYQREGLPFTFVEIHRNWDKTGLPILSSVGVLNTDPAIRVSQLKLGQSGPHLPDDPSIINASDNADGQARPDDFNTLTVTITPEGGIWSIGSNLRPLAQNQQEVSPDQIKTPQEALEELKKNQALFGLTALSGEGGVDLTQVYPGNRAQAEKAIITDLNLVYLEKPAGVKQKYLQPVYLARGTAQLKSGYTVNWTQVVPALKGINSTLSQIRSSGLTRLVQKVKQALAQNISASTSSPSLHLPGMGDFGVCPRPLNLGGTHTYCFTPSAQTGAALTLGQVRDYFFNEPVRQQYEINLARAAFRYPEIMEQLTEAVSPQELFRVFDQINAKESNRLGDCWLNDYQTSPYGAPGDIAPIRAPEPESDTVCWRLYSHRVNPMSQLVAENILAAAALQNPPVQTLLETSANTVDEGSAWFALREKQCEIGPWYQTWQNFNPNQNYPGEKSLLGEAVKNYYTSRGLEVLDVTRGEKSSGEITCQQCGCPSDFNLYLLLPASSWQKAEGFGFTQFSQITPAPTQPVSPTPTLPPATPTSPAQLTLQQLAQLPNIFPDSALHGFRMVLGIYPGGPFDQEPGEEEEARGIVYVSGESPYLFFYQDGERVSPQEMRLKIKLPASATYQELGSDPIYYEYDKSKVSFTESNTGWVVKKEKLAEWLEQELGPGLNLTPGEIKSLRIDLNRALSKSFAKPYVKVSLVEQAELDKKLPLEILEPPDQIHRVHLLLTPLDQTQSLLQPQITPLSRAGLTVAEVGVTTNH